MKHPLVLGIETATFCGGVALVAGDRLVASHTLNSQATHSGRLLGAVERVLAESSVALAQLGGLAVSIGPGSFTGVRIGLSAAKGLALAAGLPLVGVSTLEALALRVGRDERLICPVVDARRGEVFASAYRWPNGSELPIEVIAPAVLPIERFLQKLEGRCLFLGDGALRYREAIESEMGGRACFAPPHRILPSAEEVAWLGLLRIEQGRPDDLRRLEPVYIRPSDARLPEAAKRRTILPKE